MIVRDSGPLMIFPCDGGKWRISQTAIWGKGFDKRLWTLYAVLQFVFRGEAPRGRARRYVTAKAKKYLGKVKRVLEAVMEGFAPDASKEIKGSKTDVVSLTIAIGVGNNVVLHNHHGANRAQTVVVTTTRSDSRSPVLPSARLLV